ncbi:TetR/AcrR family transcriptional regulator [Pelagibacterium limicola]|uniref:TetR/AcrR family transcriptional regulator n=1 Tax=Pelagibacterium limicola TaxID=2791022 RepID=UPI0031B5C086
MEAEGRKKSGYHHADLSSALQEAALDLIAERDGPAFSLRELAAVLGVTHAAVYRHFADKASLLDVLAGRGFTLLHEYQKRELERSPPDPYEQLLALGAAYIQFALDKPGAFLLIFGNRGEEVRRAKAREENNAAALNTLLHAIERAQKCGVLLEGDPQKIAGFLVMAPHGYACYSSQDRAKIGSGALALSARQLAEINLIPVLANPPAPSEILERYFR